MTVLRLPGQHQSFLLSLLVFLEPPSSKTGLCFLLSSLCFSPPPCPLPHPSPSLTRLTCHHSQDPPSPCHCPSGAQEYVCSIIPSLLGEAVTLSAFRSWYTHSALCDLGQIVSFLLNWDTNICTTFQVVVMIKLYHTLKKPESTLTDCNCSINSHQVASVL